MIENSDIIRLTYASIKQKHVDHQMLKEILEQAIAFNQLKDITGLLIFNNRFFLQSLEGPRSEVTTLYNRITEDNRHHEVHVLKMSAIDNRYWKNWSMAYVSITDQEEAIYQKYSGSKAFNPFQIGTDVIDDFLVDITDSVMKEL